MENNGFMGIMYKFSEWVMRLATINILWFICSLPVIVFAAISLVGKDMTTQDIYSSLFMVCVLSPFFFFPATAAMFTVTRKWVMGDLDVPLFRTYFKGYKENYLKSMLGGLFFIILIAVFIVNIRFYRGQSSLLGILWPLFIVFLVLAVATMMNFFSILAHFHMKLRHIIKNAVLITIGRPIASVSMIVGNAVLMYISYIFLHLILFVFFTGSLAGFYTFWQFHRGYTKLTEKYGSDKDEEEAEGEETTEGSNSLSVHSSNESSSTFYPPSISKEEQDKS